MPYLNVYVDAEDVLEDCSTEDLKAELLRRRLRVDTNPAATCIPVPTAREALDNASRVLRKQGRTDLAFKLDEIREDYLP